LDEEAWALKTFVEKSPNNAAALYNLATVRLRRGLYQTAVESYQASLRLRPDRPPAYAYLATCYERLSQTEDVTAARSG
jgi:cytochrome c-type biogenesis protein CcmH/NrfG